MASLDVDALLQPLSSEEPCGPDLEYDSEFIELETASQGKPEQQYGDTIIPAEEPNWKDVNRLGHSLLSRTKDFRVACHLARSSAVISGLEGFFECLKLIRGYIEEYWGSVHPQLDPEDDNDPTERVNTIASLASATTTVAHVLGAPIVKSPLLGAYSMRDVQIARGEISAGEDDNPPTTASIDGAFVDCELESLRETVESLEQGLSDAIAIEAAITDAVGAAQAIAIEAAITDAVGAAQAMSLDGLTDTLRTIRDLVRDQLNARDGSQPVGDSDESGEADAPIADDEAGGGAVRVVAGEVRTREDVIRTLDKVCEYYERYEPSSPVPMLLNRAKRLATKSFLDILEDMTPDGVHQARVIGGVDNGDDDD